MRVLYVNHTAEVSGAERSLLALLQALPRDQVEPLLAAPAGRLAEEAEAIGVPVQLITGTAGSLRLHPLHTPRALAQMSRAALQLRGVARRHRVEVVHANSIRAGIVLALAQPRGATRVAHVRDCLPPGRLSTATLRLIAGGAEIVIANSAYTARSVLAAAPSARVEVAHSPVDIERFDPRRMDRDAARAAVGPAGQRSLLMGVVAQLTPWKGQDTAIAALRLLCEQGVDAHLLLIGSAKFVDRATRFDNRAYVASLEAQVAAAGLGDRVSFLGEREDVPQLMRALDVLLMPSWEEPFGRAVVEAMALEVPVVATNVGGPAEIIVPGREGYLVAPRSPDALAQAVRAIAEGGELAHEMGMAGRRRALEAFTLTSHVQRVREVYEAARREREEKPYAASVRATAKSR